MADPADFTINFRWTTDAQSQVTQIEQVKSATQSFARILTRNVAIASADNMRKEAAKTLRQRVEREVKVEINRMAKAIGRNVGVADGQTGPSGYMSMSGNTVSQTARGEWGSVNNFTAQQSGIKWNPRSKRYMRRRKQTGHWFRQTGGLENFLSRMNSSSYEAMFGPVKAIFSPRRGSDFENVNVTQSGVSGRISHKVTVGTFEVIAFNHITPQMMSGLTTMNPVGSKPARGNPGVAGLFARSLGSDNEIVRKLTTKSWGGRYKVRREVTYSMANDPDQALAARRKKMWGKSSRTRWENETHTQNREYRPAIDPFVSFFLTRAVPNAVWRRLERFVIPSDVGSAGRTR